MTETTTRTDLTRDRTAFIGIAALLTMVTINQLGTGIVSAIIPVRLAAEGYSAAAAGAVSTVFSAFFLVGCLIGPRLVGRLGATRTLLVVATVHACLAVLHWTFPGPFAWAMLRGVAGLVTATYFVLVESWLAGLTTAQTRGLIFGLYMVFIRLAFAVGQLVIVLVEPAAMTNLFFVAAVLYLVSPLFRPRTSTPPPPPNSNSLSSYLDLPRYAPAAAMAAFGHGVLFATIPSLLPKWGIEAGLTVGTIVTTLAIIQIGGILLQLPLSFISDKIERRTVMALAATGTTLTSIAIMRLPAESTWFWLLLMLLWGGFASSLYSLGFAHASDVAPPEQRVAWISSQMLIWGIGAMVGPMVAATCMDVFGPHMLWTYGTTISVALTLFFLWRKVVRPR